MTQVSGFRQGDYHQAIERLFNEGSVSGLSEAQLLERFAARNDESAFEALVERHGPMVLGVCRRFLRDPNDVDDAFQAVFLVLVRRAGDIRRKDLLGNWLYGVACRVAVRARSTAARRPATTISEVDGDQIAVDLRRSASRGPDEGRSWLHEEVERLPRRYRQPVVACYFEGRTHEEAATLLGCPLGTVKGRLSRARDLLRKRLERRGLAVPAVALAAQLASSDLRASVPVPLAHSTVRSGLALATGSTVMTTSAISLSVRTLTEGVLHAMVVTHIKAVAIPTFLVAAGVLAAGASVVARQDADGKPTQESVVVQTQPQPDEAAKPTSENSAAPEMSPPTHLTTFNQLVPWVGRFQNLRNRLFSDLIGLETDEDKKNALAVYRGRAEGMIRQILDEKDVSEAGRDLKQAFATFLRKDVETQDPAKPSPMISGSQELGRFQQLAGQYEKSSELLSADLSALKSPEARESARALHRARQAALSRWVVLESYTEPFRDFAEAFATYLKKIERHPEPPPAVAKAESPKAKSKKPAAPANPPQADQTAAPKVAKGGGAAGGGAILGPTDGERRQDITRVSAYLSSLDKNPRSQAVHKLLDQPISLQFPKETPLGVVLERIKESLKTPDGKPIPIYVDPAGLQEAEKTLESVITIDLQDMPLKFSLRLILKQLTLAYCVRDGVLIISSLEGVEQELLEAESEQIGLQSDKFPQGYTGIKGPGTSKTRDERNRLRHIGSGTSSGGFQ